MGEGGGAHQNLRARMHDYERETRSPFRQGSRAHHQLEALGFFVFFHLWYLSIIFKHYIWYKMELKKYYKNLFFIFL